MELKFRTLKPDEIECRVGNVDKNGKWITLLLYKDARVDMNILDETVGALNWKRQHCRDNSNCIVSIYDDDKKEWVSKEDTGSESNTDAEKGLASDSFKRACVNFGIGRELYSSPKIFLYGSSDELKRDNYRVSEIEYDENRNITKLVIIDSKNNEIYKYPKTASNVKPKTSSVANKNTPNSNEKPKVELLSAEQLKMIHTLLNGDEERHTKILKNYGVSSTKELSKLQATECIKILQKGNKK